jgi:hypothetical protein
LSGAPERPEQRVRLAAILLIVLAAGLGAAEMRAAQGGFFRPSPQLAAPLRPKVITPGLFHFCRLRFRESPLGDGDGWFVDWPRADINLTMRLSQLTKTEIDHEGEDDPIPIVVGLTDEMLFDCPFLMMTEPGGASFSEEEATQLRAYLLKGGFLWADDFWGSRAWNWWANQLAQVLDRNDYPIVDVPIDHPIFHTQFDVRTLPQIPNVGLWEYRHQTSERGADSAEPHARAILDRNGRIMVFMTHNTDFGDAFEREADAPDYFERFSVPGYQVAVNILLYAMTH